MVDVAVEASLVHSQTSYSAGFSSGEIGGHINGWEEIRLFRDKNYTVSRATALFPHKTFYRVALYQWSVSVIGIDLAPIPSVGLCVCLSVCLESVLWKTADWIQMPFEMVSGVLRGMGVFDGSGDRRRGRGSFGGTCLASNCNQRGLCCVVVQKCVNRPSCSLGW